MTLQILPVDVELVSGDVTGNQLIKLKTTQGITGRAYFTSAQARALAVELNRLADDVDEHRPIVRRTPAGAPRFEEVHA